MKMSYNHKTINPKKIVVNPNPDLEKKLDDDSEKKEKKDLLNENLDSKRSTKEEQDEALKKLLKDCLKEWCETTTSHGFGNIIRTDSWLIRIVWILLVIIFMAYCLYTVTICIITYFQYEINVVYQVNLDSPADFPSVTICNLNPFDVATENITGAYISNVLQENNINPTISISDNEYSIVLVEEAAEVLKAALTSNKILNKTEVKKIGFTIETMMISCFYNGIQCNESDFYWFRDHEYGNCYTFNGMYDSTNTLSNGRTTSKTGPSSGLVLELFVGASGSQDYYTIKRGIKVVVHERGMFPLMKYEGINVGTATATDIAVSRTKYSRLDEPYSNCRKNIDTVLITDSQYFRYTTQISKYYQKLCFEICMQYSQIIRNCSCADPSIPAVDSNQTICNSESDLKCVKQQRDYFNTLDLDDVCGPHCPLECDSIRYTTSISSAIYPTTFYAEILKNQTNLINKFNPANSFTPPNQPTKSIQKKRKRREKSLVLVKRAPSPLAGGSISTSVNSTNNKTNFTNTGLNQNNTIISFNNISNLSVLNNNINSNFSSIKNLTNNQTALLAQPIQPGSSSSPSQSGPSGSQPPPPPTLVNPSEDDLKNSVLMISVFYDDLRYTYVEETAAMTLETLFGILGGNFGLYMGASFLSFVEILEIIINLNRTILKYRNHVKMIKSGSSDKV